MSNSVPVFTAVRTVSLAEAKAHLSALVAAVEAGEAITITKHGRPVANLSPAHEHRSAPEAIAAWRLYRASHPAAPPGDFDVTDRRTLHTGHRY
ncbi:type II toxin-antitoxin system Phd/YefM family antitoxin [Microbacterium sp.]|uniref:type II toxin-antitoxin system Phd/YefM family antitoxin n=1 Tax=Microbacterium sp. TaxID=51671 RepID=UPI0039E3DA40